MIIDLTKQFHRLAKTSEKDHYNTSSTYDKSQFLQYSTKLLHELINAETKLSNLGTLIQKYGRLNKQQETINKQFINIQKSLKEIQKKVKNCASLTSDVKTTKQIRQKFKQQVNFILECKLLSCSLNYRKHYDIKIENQSGLLNKTHQMEDEDYRFSKSTFLQQSKAQIMERERLEQYQEIQKGMMQITETCKSMLQLVRMQELMVGNIGENTEIAYDNILQGRKNLSQVNENEKKNRQFIIKVFLVLYVFVFIYINILL